MKKSKVLLTTLGSMLLLSSTVFAGTLRPELKTNPVPVFEGSVTNTITSRAVKVTDSEVNYEWSNNSGNWVYADSFVTVKNGTVDYKHYTRVQIEKSSSVYAKSPTEWGVGKVPAETDDVAYPGENYEGRIYYGW